MYTYNQSDSYFNDSIRTQAQFALDARSKFAILYQVVDAGNLFVVPDSSFWWKSAAVASCGWTSSLISEVILQLGVFSVGLQSRFYRHVFIPQVREAVKIRVVPVKFLYWKAAPAWMIRCWLLVPTMSLLCWLLPDLQWNYRPPNSSYSKPWKPVCYV